MRTWLGGSSLPGNSSPPPRRFSGGETLNRIAAFHDRLQQPDEALAARRDAVVHLREQLDPVPVGVFGSMMARDLFESLQRIPGATVAEKNGRAAQMVLDHKITSSKVKEEMRAALASLDE